MRNTQMGFKTKLRLVFRMHFQLKMNFSSKKILINSRFKVEMLNILKRFEIFDKFLKQNEFLRLFEICYIVQNVDKGNKIAKTGLKNLFFTH